MELNKTDQYRRESADYYRRKAKGFLELADQVSPTRHTYVHIVVLFLMVVGVIGLFVFWGVV